MNPGKMILWINHHRGESLILILILLTTAMLRFYGIDGYMTFLGDEGRDALIIKRMLTTFDIPLIGPPTSVGNMYLGPLYYYMMAVPMAIFWLNPIAAAGMVALLGTVVVGLVYYLSRQWFGKTSAIIASILYSVSPVNIIYSRSSWNPNPAPLFALMAVLGLYKSRVTNNFLWFILTGISLAFAAQMHYLALILLPIFGFLWAYELSLIIRKKASRKNFLLGTIGAAASFLVLMLPLVVFDFKHNFLNYRAVTTFFGSGQNVTGFNLVEVFSKILPIYSEKIVLDYVTGQNALLVFIVALFILAPLIYALVTRAGGEALRWPFLVLGVWLIVGVAGLALYRNSVYSHYLGFLNPVPYMLFGSLVYVADRFEKKGWILKGVVLALTGILIAMNLQRSPFKLPPNNQLQRTQNIARFVIEQSGGKPFNFALIAEHNYDAAYQFYLDVYGHKPKVVPFDVTDQLFVVCEDAVCNPVGHPKHEIAAFGWVQIEDEKDVFGVKVFRLGHKEH